MFGQKFNNLQKRNVFVRIGVFIGLVILVLLLLILKSVSLALSLQVSHIVLAITMMVVTCIVYYWIIRIFIRLFKKLTKNHIKVSQKKAWILTTLAVLSMIIFHVFLALMIPDNTTVQNDFSKLTPISIIYLGIFLVILSPIVEELVIRGIFLNLFFIKKRDNEVNVRANKITRIIFSVLASSYIFTILHGATDNISIINYMFNGIIASSLYLLTKNIKTSIAYHSINNLIVFIPIIFSF